MCEQERHGRLATLPPAVVTEALPAAPVSVPHLPPLVFTLAVSGHQDILPDRHEDLKDQVKAILERTAHRIAEIRATSPLDQPRALELRFISALAPGADQIGAEAAIEAEGWSFSAILPFDCETYQSLARATLIKRDAEKERDEKPEEMIGPDKIAEAIGKIATLSGSAARVLVLSDWRPGGPSAEAEEDWQARRYATIGQMLVRQADLLIALWDGNPPRGRGGTADVVTEARRNGVPVVWIDPDTTAKEPLSLMPDAGGQPMSASDAVIGWRAAAADDKEASSLKPGTEAAITRAVRQAMLGHHRGRAICIENYLKETPARRWITRATQDNPAPSPKPGDTSWLYAVMLYLFLRLPTRAMARQSEADKLEGKQPGKLRGFPLKWARREGKPWVWRLVQLYPFDFGVERGEAGTRNAAPLLDYAERADLLATRLSNQYRSAYVWIFALAPVAVAMAVVSTMLKDWKPALVALELGAVSLAAYIFLRTSALDPVVWPDEKLSWWRKLRLLRSRDVHQRWLDARLIADSQRSGQLLAWAGFSGRRPIEEHNAADPEEDQPDPQHEHADHEHADHGHAPPRTVWAPHFANAIAALPQLPHDGVEGQLVTPMDPARVADLAAAAGKVIAHQRVYHDLNHQRLEKLNHRLDTFSLGAIGFAFVVSAAFMVFWGIDQPGPVGLWPLPGGEGTWLHDVYYKLKDYAAIFGAVLPAVAAAAAGIRFQGDFERFAMRSKDTAERLAALADRAAQLADRAHACGTEPCAGQPPLFEPLLDLLLDTQGVLDEDLADWRFAYAARPITLG